MSVVGMASAGPHPPFANCGNSAGAGTTSNGERRQACSESLVSSRGKFGPFSAPHQLNTHPWVGE